MSNFPRLRYSLAAALLLAFLAVTVRAQEVDRAPDRSEGEGPFDRLVLRGATLIDGTVTAKNASSDADAAQRWTPLRARPRPGRHVRRVDWADGGMKRET